MKSRRKSAIGDGKAGESEPERQKTKMMALVIVAVMMMMYVVPMSAFAEPKHTVQYDANGGTGVSVK